MLFGIAQGTYIQIGFSQIWKCVNNSVKKSGYKLILLFQNQWMRKHYSLINISKRMPSCQWPFNLTWWFSNASAIILNKDNETS